MYIYSSVSTRMMGAKNPSIHYTHTELQDRCVSFHHNCFSPPEEGSPFEVPVTKLHAPLGMSG